MPNCIVPSLHSYLYTTTATMVVSMQRVKQVSGSHHNNATMQQSNKSLPLQLASSKNNYKNDEVMLPKQNSYFYDTTAAHNPKKYICSVFLKVQTVQWTDIMSIRLRQSRRIYSCNSKHIFYSSCR